jgi:ABC-type Na+ efflux pump permease subunit
MTVNLQSFVPVVLALQFAVFGWRINREISLDDEDRRTWLLVSDYFILLSMLAVLAFCIIMPIATGGFSNAAKVCLAVAFVLVIFYPIILAGHYRLFSKKGRSWF